MRKEFLSNLSLILLLNFLVKPFYVLGVETQIQNAVGPFDFGIYSAILSFTFLLNILLDGGITNFNTRNIAQHRQLLSKHFGGIVRVRLTLGGVYLLLLLLFGSFLNYVQEHFWMLFLLGFNQFLVASILYCRSNLAGLHRFKADAFISVLDRGLLLVFMGALLLFPKVFGEFQIMWLVYGQSLAYFIALVSSLILLRKNLSKLQLRGNKAFSKMILKKSLPYALLILLSMAYYKTDAVMLEQLLGDDGFSAGIYAMGFRFFEASNMIGFLFAGLLLPIFSRLIKQKESLDSIASSAFQLLFTGGLLLAGVPWLVGEEILDVFYHEHLELALRPFQILMSAFFFVMMSYLFGTILTARGDMKLMNYLALFGVIINLALNFFLIHNYQAEGSAWASLFTQGLISIAQMFLALRYSKLKFSQRTLLTMAVFTIFLGVLFYGLTISSLPWLFKGGTFVCLGLAGAFLTRFLRVGQFKELLQR
jgi:O-antigen/teichoic acid export membrane protein